MATPENILFNALKHHRGFICRQLQTANVTSLQSLGNSQMDIYFGSLDLDALFKEVITLIPTDDEASYLAWLNGGYKEITLSDTSRWVLLHGTEPGKYIHLHPARYSPHSLRVKATILKTAMAIIIANAEPDLDTVNHIRRSISLSPVKSLEQCEHLWEVLEMLHV
ncbi:hypothetical protein GO495_29560 [Chitinophaga oryziterrae]|uniref:Uncharacterized protein n=1 Tax=Chitinophaga oryziterrae TaxID=1031224 RepID=A0A6N8JHS6_9BACT|nr:hypothetical protein [Chitinophaga oryziterrae]MVT44777.1 hypothetical protein [Chitinophaga oryziterrae]